MGLFKSITDSIGLTRPDPRLVEVPPAIRPRDVINEILGVETVEEEFTRPDGTKGKRLVTRTNLSPEEEARLEELDKAYDNLFADLNSLVQTEAAITSPVFEPVVTAVRQQQAEARSDAFKERSRLEEEVLARRGIADSTAATELRQQRSSDLSDQAVKDERNLILLAEQLRNDQLQRTGIGLNFAAGQRQQDLSNRVAGGQQTQAAQLNFFGAENDLQNFRTSVNLKNAEALRAADSAQRTAIGETISGLYSSLTGGLGVDNSPIKWNSPRIGGV